MWMGGGHACAVSKLFFKLVFITHTTWLLLVIKHPVVLCSRLGMKPGGCPTLLARASSSMSFCQLFCLSICLSFCLPVLFLCVCMSRHDLAPPGASCGHTAEHVCQCMHAFIQPVCTAVGTACICFEAISSAVEMSSNAMYHPRASCVMSCNVCHVRFLMCCVARHSTILQVMGCGGSSSGDCFGCCCKTRVVMLRCCRLHQAAHLRTCLVAVLVCWLFMTNPSEKPQASSQHHVVNTLVHVSHPPAPAHRS